MILKSRYSETALTIDIVLRLFAVSLMWWNVILGYLINGLLDAIDGDVLQKFGVKRDRYQKQDKILDTWWYIAIFIYTVLYLPRDFTWEVLIVAFFVRILGFILYMLIKKEWLLFAFPCLFNWLFFFRVAFPGLFTTNDHLTYFTIIVLFIFTLWREWQLHVAKIDMTHLLFPWKAPKKW